MKEKPPYNLKQEEQAIWKILQQVNDPEIPAISITDLGIVRQVALQPTPVAGQPEVCVTITPTYSGCPALNIINMDIRLKLIENGYENVVIRQSLSPAWTTDWMSETGKQKLKEAGIAPPLPKQQFCATELFSEEAVPCPHCGSSRTILLSRFGTAACKAVYQCKQCQETFDYFKCH